MKITRRTTLSFALAMGLTCGLFGLVAPTPAVAKIATLEEATTELVMGNDDAPVEIIEYASLSCPACRHFHETVYPKLKTEYIDTGKVRFIYRDFPTNTPGLAAAMIARCAGPDRHAGMVDMFFDTQPQWGRAENPMQALGMIARMGGIGPTEVDECLKNTALMNAIQEKARIANENEGVNATPTVFVAGEKAEHALEWEKLKEVIDAALAKVQ